MARLYDIVDFLNRYLEISKIPDHSINGFQVEGKKEVKKIALAVDASLDTFQIACDNDADMVIVHHGLFWEGTDPRMVGVMGQRVSKLIKNDISLYTAHLPLDFHKDVGNSVEIARILEVSKLKPFGMHMGIHAGHYGVLKKDMSIEDFVLFCEERIGRAQVKHLFGTKRIRTVGIVTGGGAFAVPEIAKTGVDVLISGEAKHGMVNETRELGVNALYFGHYQTETYGVKALGTVISKKFRDVSVFFVDNPTGL